MNHYDLLLCYVLITWVAHNSYKIIVVFLCVGYPYILHNIVRFIMFGFELSPDFCGEYEHYTFLESL